MPFLSSAGPLYQNEVRCPAFDMEMFFHSHGSKTRFHKKGCALGLILKVRLFRTRKLLDEVEQNIVICQCIRKKPLKE